MENQIKILKVQSDDLENVVNTVKKYINTYETRVSPIAIRFLFFYSDNPDFAAQFDELRKELVPIGYIPFVQQDGENFVEVSRRPPVRYRENWVNIVMLVLTLASTIYVGSQLSADFVSPFPQGVSAHRDIPCPPRRATAFRPTLCLLRPFQLCQRSCLHLAS